MAHTDRYHSALIIAGYDDDMLKRLGDYAAATMEDYGHPVDRVSAQNDHTVRVTASHYVIKLTIIQRLTPGEDGQRTIRLDSFTPSPGNSPDKQRRVVIEIYPADPERDDRDISEMLMVVMLYRMIEDFSVEMVEWLDPLTLLTAQQFLDVFANMAPTVVTTDMANAAFDPFGYEPLNDLTKLTGYHHAEMPAIPLDPEFGCPKGPSDEDLLTLAMRAEARPEELARLAAEAREGDIRRLATWGMTGMIAFLSAPVAVSVAAVNLARGEDLRLNTHVLSLTGFLVTLQSTGALASAVSHLPL